MLEPSRSISLSAAALFIAACATTRTAADGAPAPVRDSLSARSSAVALGGTTLLLGEERRPQPMSMFDLLQGRIAGLAVERRANGGVALRLRGAGGSFGADPLVVVDGDPLPDGAAMSGFLAAIPPADVVRVDVLRDPASTLLYGPRAAHGVVLITLRHAAR